jgi:hypothetical protein
MDTIFPIRVRAIVGIWEWSGACPRYQHDPKWPTSTTPRDATTLRRHWIKAWLRITGFVEAPVNLVETRRSVSPRQSWASLRCPAASVHALGHRGARDVGVMVRGA